MAGRRRPERPNTWYRAHRMSLPASPPPPLHSIRGPFPLCLICRAKPARPPMPLARTLLLLVLTCSAASTSVHLIRPNARRLLVPPAKVDVCHYDAPANSYQLITVPVQAWVRCWQVGCSISADAAFGGAPHPGLAFWSFESRVGGPPESSAGLLRLRGLGLCRQAVYRCPCGRCGEREDVPLRRVV